MNYPYIQIEIEDSFGFSTKYLNIEQEKFLCNVYFYYDEKTKQKLLPNNSNVSYKIFDDNFYIIDENNEFYIIPTESGSCYVGFYFQFGDESYFNKIEILAYKPFFRNNYLNYLVTPYDSNIIESTPKYKAMFDTIMEYFDILFTFKDDIQTINDPEFIKTKFLNLFGNEVGFERVDFSKKDTQFELTSNILYRELLTNLVDILGLRGSVLSFELFFNALGYEIEIKEFWYDGNQRLIEISDNEDTSTFYSYLENGIQSDEVQVAHPDPRVNVSVNNKFNEYQKSKYIRPEIKLIEKFHNKTQFDDYDRFIIKKYLDYLKPNNIEYLLEVLKINCTSEGNEDIIEMLIEYPVSQIQLPTYPNDPIVDDEPEHEVIIGNTIIEQLTGMIQQPPGLNGGGTENFGTWNWDFQGAAQLRYKRVIDDIFTISNFVSLNDIIIYNIMYDRNYKYDEKDRYYDVGIILSDDNKVLPVNTIVKKYNTKINNGVTKTIALKELSDEYNSTPTQINILIRVNQTAI